MFGYTDTLGAAATANAANQIANYQAQANAIKQTAPRELRVLERIEGVRSGLVEINGRLESFMQRLAGPAPTGVAADQSPTGGLIDTIADAENLIRRNIDLLIKLNDAF